MQDRRVARLHRARRVDRAAGQRGAMMRPSPFGAIGFGRIVARGAAGPGVRGAYCSCKSAGDVRAAHESVRMVTSPAFRLTSGPSADAGWIPSTPRIHTDADGANVFLCIGGASVK